MRALRALAEQGKQQQTLPDRRQMFKTAEVQWDLTSLNLSREASRHFVVIFTTTNLPRTHCSRCEDASPNSSDISEVGRWKCSRSFRGFAASWDDDRRHRTSFSVCLSEWAAEKIDSGENSLCHSRLAHVGFIFNSQFALNRYKRQATATAVLRLFLGNTQS